MYSQAIKRFKKLQKKIFGVIDNLTPHQFMFLVQTSEDEDLIAWEKGFDGHYLIDDSPTYRFVLTFLDLLLEDKTFLVGYDDLSYAYVEFNKLRINYYGLKQGLLTSKIEGAKITYVSVKTKPQKPVRQLIKPCFTMSIKTRKLGK